VSAALAIAHGAPWWAFLGLVLAGLAAYIYRLYGVFRLAGKALDKAEHDEVAAVMTTVTGRSATRRAPRRRGAIRG
jgi:hypothetical protein